MIVYGIEEILFRIHILRVGIAGNEQGFIHTDLVAEIAKTNLLIIIEPFFRVGRKGRCLSDGLVRRVEIEQRIGTGVASSLSEIATKDFYLLQNLGASPEVVGIAYAGICILAVGNVEFAL
jgi:hypothetical protein